MDEFSDRAHLILSTMPICPGRSGAYGRPDARGNIAPVAERPIHRDPEGYFDMVTHMTTAPAVEGVRCKGACRNWIL